MMDDKKTILATLMKENCCPILLEKANSKAFKDAVIIDSNCDRSILNGHYEELDFVAPDWYRELLNKNNPILLIKDLNVVSKEEQYKFNEILKYRKVSTFMLPENCIIIATCKDLQNSPINEDIYSLFAHV